MDTDYRSKLEKMRKLGICDKDTVNALQTEDTFTISQIEKIYEQMQTETNEALGRKLLFLEEFLGEPEDTRTQVIKWLEDEKRAVLFNESSQADLYGELLVARAQGKLPELRRQQNPQSKMQEPFVYKRELTIILSPEELSTYKEGMDILRMKLDSVLENMGEDAYGDIQEKIWDLESDYENRENLIESEVENLEEGGYLIDGVDIDLMKESQVSDLEHRIDILYGRFMQIFGNERVQGETVDECLDKTETIGNLIENLKYLLDECKERLYEDLDDLKKRMLDGYQPGYIMDIGTNIIDEAELSTSYLAELVSIQEEIVKSPLTSSSEKIKKPRKFVYNLELSEKDPLDVRYGNDSGSCIGIFREDIANADGLPHMIADNATYFFNVYQAIGKGKKRRVGIVLAFDTVDEKGKRVLACNSLELSPKMNPQHFIEKVVDYVESGLIDFANQNDFDEVIMSNHSYNTSRNFSRRSKQPSALQTPLRKVRSPTEPTFYSEVLDRNGNVTGEFYKLN